MSRALALLALFVPSVAFAADTTAPTPTSLVINGGDAYTNTATVSLSLSASDDVGVSQMCVSTSSTLCSTWVSYATTYSYSLGTTQGTRTLYVKFRDAAGNTSVAVSDSIVLDTGGPTGGSASTSFTGSGSLGVSWSGFTDTYSGVSSYQVAYRTGSAPASKCTSGTVVSTAGTSATLSGLSDGTTYYIRVCPVDGAGNVGSGVTTSGVAKAEENAPSGTVVINGGNTYTTSSGVTLTLSATDDTGVTQMCVSNTSTCTAWVAYTTTKTWTLSSLGSNTVYVYFKDSSGNVSAAATDSIFSDPYAPILAVSAFPSNASVDFYVSASELSSGSGVSYFEVYRSAASMSGSCASTSGTLIRTITISGWSDSKSFNDTGLTNGTTYYYKVCAYDQAGNYSAARYVSAKPVSELAPPTSGSVSINGGATWTNSSSVTLSLSATDPSGVARMCISNSSTCTSWQTYATTKTWTLGGSGTTRTVRAWFEDSNGNQTTTAVSDTINLDAVKPTNGLLSGAAATVSVGLSWGGFSDATSGIASYKVVYAQSSTAPASCSVGTTGYVGTGTAATISGLNDGTTYAFRVCALDNAGNLSTGATKTLTTLADTTPPTGTITLNGGATVTNNPTVTVALAATDTQSGVTGLCLAETTSCTSFPAYQTSTTWTFSPVEGAQTLYATFRDGAGNTSSPTSATILLDTTPPTDGAASAVASGTSVDLSWSGFSDALSGVSSYIVAYNLDGAEPADCTSADILTSLSGTTTTLTGLSSGLSYTFRVCATDGAGNTSAGTTVSSCTPYTWHPDADDDGYADTSQSVVSCTDPSTVTPMDGVADTTLTGDTAYDYFGVGASLAGDVNGDGYDDVIVGAEVAGRAYLYHGSSSGLVSTPARTLSGSASDSFGRTVSSAGDINDDGYDDVIVGAYQANDNMGRAYVYHGSAAGIDATPALILDGEATDDLFGYAISDAGDVDGDGIDDVLIGARGSHSGAGRAYLYRGSETGLSATPAVVLDGEASSSAFGYALAGARDINGDGHNDVVVGAYGYGTGAGRAYLYHGASGGVDTTPAVVLDGEAGVTYFGFSVDRAGDVNQDGFADVIIGAYRYSSSRGRAYVYHGSASGLSTIAASTLTGEANGNKYATSVSMAGDVDDDGYDDVLVSAPTYATNQGRAYLYHGSASGVLTTAALTVTGASQANLGNLVAEAGDVNGDGGEDLLIAALEYYGVQAGHVYVYHGASHRSYVRADLADPDCDDTDPLLTVGSTWYTDDDGDGYGDTTSVYTCSQPAGTSALSGDCDDSAATAYPTAAEICDGLDNNCDGLADDADATVIGQSVWYADDDGDGYGDDSSALLACAAPSNYVSDGSDCDDTSASTAGPVTWYQDSDGDLYGDPSTAVVSCTEPNGVTSQVLVNVNAALPGDFGVSDAGDVNADGFDDIIVGKFDSGSSEGQALIFHGSASGLITTPATTLGNGTPSEFFGWAVSNAGDIDNDGYDDVMVSNHGSSSLAQVSFYHGSANGIQATPATVLLDLTPPAINNLFGYTINHAGDVNNDGYSDVIISSPYYNSSTGRAYLYHGSANGIETAPARTYAGTVAGSHFGFSATAGDVNHDGYDDVVISESGLYSTPGTAHIYHGSAAGLATTANLSLSGTMSGSYFGWSARSAGDVDHDGDADLIVGAFGVGGIGQSSIYHGASSGLSTTASVVLSGEAIADQFGFSVDEAGDWNGDGFDDVIVGAKQYGTNEGRVYLYHGSAAGVASTAAEVWTGSVLYGQFGKTVSNAGDINGDGRGDLLVATSSDAYVFMNTGSYVDASLQGADCDDSSSASNPSGAELCDGLDNDCDGLIDEADPDLTGALTWYTDSDGDGFGALPSVSACSAPAGFVAQGGDCNDSAAAAYPGAAEICDTLDNDCDGLADDADPGVTDPTVWFIDQDNDGFGDSVELIVSCETQPGYVANSNDCDDATAAIGAPANWWVDADHDGFGDPDTTSEACADPSDVQSTDAVVDASFAGASADANGTAVAAAGDVNGDGYDDFVVGSSGATGGAGMATVYHGSASGIVEAQVLPGSGTDANGVAVAAGDVNNDGYDDIIVGAPYYKNSRGRMLVYHGSLTGVDSNPAVTVIGTTVGDRLGSALTVGDVNNDGCPDVVVGMPGMSGNTGGLQVHTCSASGLNTVASQTLTGATADEQFGAAMGLADINGDGDPDIIVGSPGYSAQSGQVGTYHGAGAALFSSTPTRVLTGSSGAALGTSISGGDVDLDGYDDVLIGAPGFSSGRGRAYLYEGSATGLTGTISLSFTGTNVGDGLGASVQLVGDVNVDGALDALIGSPGDGPGRTALYFGYAGGLTLGHFFTGESSGDTFGAAVSGAGDLNADGSTDMLVGAPGYNSGAGRTYVYYGDIATDFVNASTGAADCNDSQPMVSPLADEVCDQQDNDCDGVTDDADPDIIGQSTWYVDTDGDGFGDSSTSMLFCAQPTGFVANTGDCNDSSALAWSGAPEVCDSVDNDCDGAANDADPGVIDQRNWFADSDSDSFGDAAVYATACVAPPGFVDDAQDCDDDDAGVGAPYTWYLDADADSYGDSSSGVVGCDDPSVLVTMDSTYDLSLSDCANSSDACVANAAGDVNDDGFDDVIVSSFGTTPGHLYVYHGDSAGLIAAPAANITDSTYSFGVGANTAGDVNGDGYSDVLVSAAEYNAQMGRVSLYHGSASGLRSTAALVLTGPTTVSAFGRWGNLGSAGDVNGDGYDDVLIGASAYNSNIGRAYVYHGSVSGLASSPAWTQDGTVASGRFGHGVRGAGDINGDGYDDVLIGAYSANTVSVYHGSTSGLSTTSALTLSSSPGSNFGWSVSAAGDTNGDGYDDVVVGAYNALGAAGMASLYHGSASGLNPTAAQVWYGGASLEGFGYNVRAGGDLNADGYADVVISSSDLVTYAGIVSVYFGGPSGVPATPEVVLSDAAIDAFGWMASGAGDLNADGASELVLGTSADQALIYMGEPGLFYVRADLSAPDSDDSDPFVY